MRKLLVLPLLFILASCGDPAGESGQKTGPADSLQTRIGELEKRVYGSDSKAFDEEGSLLLMNAYVDYQAASPEGEKSPGYLLKAAGLAKLLGDHRKAVRYYETVYEEYPAFEDRPLALFEQAAIYDELQDEEKAKELYTKFITEHPDHHLRDDAEALISHLGKSDEELIREFEKRNAQ